MSALPYLLALSTWSTSAQLPAKPSDPNVTKQEAVLEASGPPAPLEALVFGFYLQMRAGGGYTLKSQNLDADADYPDLRGQSESLGAGSLVDLTLGYDITESVGLQLTGGLAVLNGRRSDKVRSLSIVYGGLGPRVALPLADRFKILLAAHVLYAKSDNLVEQASTGLGVGASVGIEYFVHVRHFSVGLDLAALAPLTPLRVHLALAPRLRYTF